MRADVVDLAQVDRTDVARVGGKGANLGELSKIDGIRVPDGFCVTTAVFERVVAPAIDKLLDRGESAAAIRRVIEALVIPEDVAEAIAAAVARLGAQGAYAVRSSATAEDLPSASFAGQQDTFLNVVGAPVIMAHVSRCWASLFTERAVAYRAQHGFDHRKVRMAVVVQRMIAAEAAGVLFTADPITGDRTVSSIEAVLGLGEALVSGQANAHGYKVRDGDVIERATTAVLTDERIVRLAQLGRQIEAHLGHPQDIEWCLLDDEIHVVQSRPITTLFPIPEAADGAKHVYISVGHQQMMTDAMKPLGLSLFQMSTGGHMVVAGGRLFVDVTNQMSSPAGRHVLLNVLGPSDPLVKDALTTLLERGYVVESPAGAPAGPPPPNYQAKVDDDPAIVADLIARNRASIEALRQDIRTRSGTDLLDFIDEDVQQSTLRIREPQNFAAVVTGMNSATWINQHVLEWLGEKNAADTLAQSAPNNVTSEMGLALLDVADAIRPHPEVVAYLQDAKDEGFLQGLLALDGGREAHDAIRAYLDRYGMRCAGEIDVTRTRWSEAPTTLAPLILGNIKNFEPGAGARRFEQGQRLAAKKEQALLDALRRLPDGEQKAAETQREIRRLRNFAGYREYPKYGIVNRFFLYRHALLDEAERLVRGNVLREREDIYFLTFPELREVVRTRELDHRMIDERKAQHERNQKLTPPRVLTSDGEVIAGAYKRDGLPANALVGLAVSAGVVEGRARVLLDIADAELEPGDILVTAFTDPSWTPVFVSIQALVTEVGGRMTHGAVIAREYGLPAVTGVANATRLIADGQRIRVNGTEGYVQILA